MAMAGRPRVRDWGLLPGTLTLGVTTGIADVVGVRVGHATLISGAGRALPAAGCTGPPMREMAHDAD
jgi:L-aminopeptidase/D-esterase-like protein